jgi:hypothetical protein
MRATLLDLRRLALPGFALWGALSGCGLDFKVVVGGIPADSSVSALLISLDSGDRRADAAAPVDITRFAVASRQVSAAQPDPTFSFALDAMGLSPVSGQSRISVAAIGTSSGAPCLRATGSTQASLSDNPSFGEIRVDLLPQVQGTQQVPSAMPGCGITGPIILGVRRELSGPLDQSQIRFFINGWNFGLKNKVTVRRCRPVLTPRPGAGCAFPPPCGGLGQMCCTSLEELTISCSVDGNSPVISESYFQVRSVGKAAIELTLVQNIFAGTADSLQNLASFLSPLHFTVEAQDAAGNPTGAPATYVEPPLKVPAR